MTQLFTLPGQKPLSTAGAPMAGCKLTFSQTGTSTPQNTYQDSALTTPHANPVVADAAGLFAPIYLDPSLPDYRVVLSTSADVVLKTWDEIPSNQNTSQQFRLVSGTPSLIMYETDASSGNSRWRISAASEEFSIELLNDAESVASDVMRVKRSGTDVTEITFGGLQPILGRHATKTGSTTRASTTTLADDPSLALDLSGPLTSQAAYVIEGVLYFNGGSAGAGGIKLGFNYDGTIADQNDAVIHSYVNGSGATSRSPMTAANPLTFATLGTTNRGDWVRFSKVVSPQTLGTYTLQWAQNSSVASPDGSTLSIFSYIRAQRVLGGG